MEAQFLHLEVFFIFKLLKSRQVIIVGKKMHSFSNRLRKKVENKAIFSLQLQRNVSSRTWAYWQKNGMWQKSENQVAPPPAIFQVLGRPKFQANRSRGSWWSRYTYIYITSRFVSSLKKDEVLGKIFLFVPGRVRILLSSFGDFFPWIGIDKL